MNEDAEGLLIFDVFAKQMTKAVTNRGSRSQMSFKIGPLKNFKIFTENTCVGVSFLIKLLAFRPVTLLKRDSNASVFL